MKYNKISTLLYSSICIMSMFSIFSCSENDTPKNDKIITLEPVLTEFEESTSMEATSFANGDEIGLYLTKSSEDYTPVNRYDNLKYTMTNGIWVNERGEKGFPELSSDYNVITYYPYSAEATSSNIVFTIPNDQSSMEKLRKADFRLGVSTVAEKTDNVGISMKHVFSLITVNIKYPIGIEDIAQNIEMSILPTSTVNINTGKQQTLGKVGNIEMCKLNKAPEGYSKSFSAIIPPQTLKGNCLTIQFKDGTSKAYQVKKTLDTGKHFTINLSIIGNKEVHIDGITVGDWDKTATITGGEVTRVYNYKDGDCITYMKNRDEKPVTIVVLPEGFTKEQMAYGGLFEQKARAALDFFFDTEPYKTYKNMFNVYMIAAISKQSGADSLASQKYPNMPAHMRDTYFDAGWEYDGEYNMKIDEDKVYNFVKKYCPDIQEKKTKIEKVPVFVLINDQRFGGLTAAKKDGRAIGMTPMSEGILEWPGVDPKITGRSIGDWRNTFLHENGGHAFGRLEDEYVISGEYTGPKEIETHTAPVPFGLNITADISPESKTIFWKDLIGNKDFPKVGLYEGGKRFVKGIWRSERISCMIDNRRYFNTWSRYLIVKRIHDIAEIPFTFKDFLKKDVNFDEIVDGGGKTRSTVHKKTYPGKTIKCGYPHPPVFE